MLRVHAVGHDEHPLHGDRGRSRIDAALRTRQRRRRQQPIACVRWCWRSRYPEVSGSAEPVRSAARSPPAPGAGPSPAKARRRRRSTASSVRRSGRSCAVHGGPWQRAAGPGSGARPAARLRRAVRQRQQPAPASAPRRSQLTRPAHRPARAAASMMVTAWPVVQHALAMARTWTDAPLLPRHRDAPIGAQIEGLHRAGEPPAAEALWPAALCR